MFDDEYALFDVGRYITPIGICLMCQIRRFDPLSAIVDALCLCCALWRLPIALSVIVLTVPQTSAEVSNLDKSWNNDKAPQSRWRARDPNPDPKLLHTPLFSDCCQAMPLTLTPILPQDHLSSEPEVSESGRRRAHLAYDVRCIASIVAPHQQGWCRDLPESTR